MIRLDDARDSRHVSNILFVYPISLAKYSEQSFNVGSYNCMISGEEIIKSADDRFLIEIQNTINGRRLCSLPDLFLNG